MISFVADAGGWGQLVVNLICLTNQAIERLFRDLCTPGFPVGWSGLPPSLDPSPRMVIPPPSCEGTGGHTESSQGRCLLRFPSLLAISLSDHPFTPSSPVIPISLSLYQLSDCPVGDIAEKLRQLWSAS